jgi:hypothetical protein
MCWKKLLLAEGKIIKKIELWNERICALMTRNGKEYAAGLFGLIHLLHSLIWYCQFSIASFILTFV